MNSILKINYINENETIGANVLIDGLKEYKSSANEIKYNDKGVYFTLYKEEITMLKRFLAVCKGEFVNIRISPDEKEGGYKLIFKCENPINKYKASLEFNKYGLYEDQKEKMDFSLISGVLLEALKIMSKKQKHFNIYFECCKPIILLDDKEVYVVVAVNS